MASAQATFNRLSRRGANSCHRFALMRSGFWSHRYSLRFRCSLLFEMSSRFSRLGMGRISGTSPRTIVRERLSPAGKLEGDRWVSQRRGGGLQSSTAIWADDRPRRQPGDPEGPGPPRPLRSAARSADRRGHDLPGTRGPPPAPTRRRLPARTRLLARSFMDVRRSSSAWRSRASGSVTLACGFESRPPRHGCDPSVILAACESQATAPP